MIPTNPVTCIAIAFLVFIFLLFGYCYFDIKLKTAQRDAAISANKELINKISEQNAAIEKYKADSLNFQNLLNDYIRTSKKIIKIDNEKINSILNEKVPDVCEDAVKWAKVKADIFK